MRRLVYLLVLTTIPVLAGCTMADVVYNFSGAYSGGGPDDRLRERHIYEEAQRWDGYEPGR